MPDTLVVGGAKTIFPVDPKYGSLLSAAATLTLGSTGPADYPADHAKLFAGAPAAAGIAFSTKAEPALWAQVDFGKVDTIKGVMILARLKGKPAGGSLAIQLSDDGQIWKDAWSTTEAKPRWFAEVSEVRADTLGVPARYLRLRQATTRPAELALQRVEVYGE